MKENLNILILESEGCSPAALARYRSLGRVVIWADLPARGRGRALASADILVVRLAHRIDTAWLDRMPRLRLIVTPTTGLTHIDMNAAQKRGIKILSLRGADVLKGIPSTAEETMGLILSLVRRIPWAFEDVKRGRWNRDAWRGHQLSGKILGIVGLGRLGGMMARYARSFGMRVIAADPHVSAGKMASARIEKVSIAALFKKADIVSVHAILTDETRDMIQKGHLKSMKRSAYLVNTARAELIEEGALAEALRHGWIAGAAVDVLRNENGKGTHLAKDPLWRYAKTNTNLLIVPHLGGATYEAMATTEEWIAREAVRTLR